MEVIFFKSDTIGPIRVCCTPDGKIDFCELGAGFGLEPGSITLCGVWFPYTDGESKASWTQIKNVLGVAGTKEDPVLVEGRQIIEAPRELSSELPDKLLQDLTDYLAARKAKDKLKKSVKLSAVSQSIWDAIQQQERLTMKFTDINPSQKHLSDLPAFGWDDRQERAQAERYIPHLSKIRRGREWVLIDAANNHPTLLSGCLGGWNFKGTTDVAIVKRNAFSYPRSELKCILELKKDLRGGCQKAVIQTLVCLVMANVFAPDNRPFAVLTDLNDFWSSYWMDGSTIYWCGFDLRACAVGHIEELLRDSDNIETGTSEALAMCASPHGESVSPVCVNKRRKYEPLGMDSLKDLVGLIPDEEIVSARVQLGVQELQSLLRTPLFSGAPDKDATWPDSVYC